MLPMCEWRKQILNGCRFSFLLMAVFYIAPAFAAPINVTSLSAASMLQNIASQVPQLTQLVTAIAYVAGMFLVLSGVIKLKHVGEMRTQMSHEHSIAAPLITIAVGAMLIYLPTTVNVGLATFWTDPNPYGYTSQEGQWEEFINACYVIIQFVGVVAFIRGLFLISKLGRQGGGHSGELGKGLTHIIGGIFCINMYQTIQVILVTLGIQT